MRCQVIVDTKARKTVQVIGTLEKNIAAIGLCPFSMLGCFAFFNARLWAFFIVGEHYY